LSSTIVKIPTPSYLKISIQRDECLSLNILQYNNRRRKARKKFMSVVQTFRNPRGKSLALCWWVLATDEQRGRPECLGLWPRRHRGAIGLMQLSARNEECYVKA
jgi:hypothetical protein